MRIRRSTVAALALVVLVLGSACSSDDGADSSSEETPAPTTAVSEPLQILVTNDDGVGAAGIDALVQGLIALPDTEVTVVAPSENQSGSGSQTTPGTLTVTDATTASGYPAKSVAGFPADTIIWAIDQGGIEGQPDLVISGINAGQNLGPAVDISGTVGAAKAAVARGIPALAVSQGFSETPDFPAAVDEALSWLDLHRAELEAGAAPVDVANLNVPTCATGTVRGAIEQPVAAEAGDRNVIVVDCLSTKDDFVDDIDAFINGYAVLSTIAA